MKIKLFIAICFLCFQFSCMKSESTSTSSQSSNSFSSISIKNFDIIVDIATSDSVAFEEQIFIDLNADEYQIDNYSGEINYDVEQIVFNISEFQGNEYLKANFQISFATETDLIGSTLPISQIPLQSFSNEGNFSAVNFSQPSLLIVENEMSNSKEIYLNIKGLVDGKPVNFKSTFKIRIKISSK